MKTCIQCKQQKTIEQFYKHNAMKDGALNKCKQCCKKYAEDRRYGEMRPKILMYDRLRGFNRYKTQNHLQTYRKNNPEKYKAHQCVQKRRKTPCIICGTIENIHRHHPDYSRPDYYVCLCASHHRQLHANRFSLIKNCDLNENFYF